METYGRLNSSEISLKNNEIQFLRGTAVSRVSRML